MNLFIFSVCFVRAVFFGKSFRCSLKMAANFFDPNNRERQKISRTENRMHDERKLHWTWTLIANGKSGAANSFLCCVVSFLGNEMEYTCGPIYTDRLISLFPLQSTKKWISIEICECRKYKTFCCNNHNLINSTRCFNWPIIRCVPSRETGEEVKCRVTASSNKYFGIRN